MLYGLQSVEDLQLHTMDTTSNWSLLPDHVIVNIFSYMTLREQHKASQTCCSWSFAFSSPQLWNQVSLHFQTPEEDEELVKLLERFGGNVRSLRISVDQNIEANRGYACRLIWRLAELPQRQLQDLVVCFVGQNPCMYSGQEFVDALSALFGPRADLSSEPDLATRLVLRPSTTLKKVDLSGLLVSFSGQLLETLSANNPDLEVLNIQNNVLVCEVDPDSILTLVRRCRKLRELRIFSWSCTVDVLLGLAEEGREPLRILSIFCRREQKYVHDIPSTVWQRLTARLPGLRVTLGFDHTCPLLSVREVLKSEIPISELRLETVTDLWDEVNLACAYYKDTLEKLIVKSPPSRHELDAALLEVARCCQKLRSLHVLYVLQRETVEEILERCPFMRENGTYTLKYVAEPHPWMPGKDFW